MEHYPTEFFQSVRASATRHPSRHGHEDLLVDASTGIVLDTTDAPNFECPDLPRAMSALHCSESEWQPAAGRDHMIGHYWLRAPELAPTTEISLDIRRTWEQVKALQGSSHERVLVLGVGGSSLGIEMLHHALRDASTPELICLDNCDPGGMSDKLACVDPRHTAVVVVSKSGRTMETMLALEIAQAHWQRAGISFGRHAIGVSMPDTPLATLSQGFLDFVPMWDFVGGRFSVTSAAGIVPMALLGLDWQSFLDGARTSDDLNRLEVVARNPAGRLAALWWNLRRKAGVHSLAFVPYRDRLALVPRYLQQLIMESLGKTHSKSSVRVSDGFNVLGNRGSSDQHSLLQMFIEGRAGTFVHFIESYAQEPVSEERWVTKASDHLVSALLGTRESLALCGRGSATLGLRDLRPSSLGALVALFERSVGLYAELAGIDAYGQPAVECGKKASSRYVDLLATFEAMMSAQPLTAIQLGQACNIRPILAWRLARHLVESGRARSVPAMTAMQELFFGLEVE
jgi:glucose-6-phosphate isomerase